jgi:hypothetical protein
MMNSDRCVYYISIGNSDDKLVQTEWAQYCYQVHRVVSNSGPMYGEWYSPSNSSYQNACFCVEIPNDDAVERLRVSLSILCRSFGQDSIAFASAKAEFIVGAE